MLKFPEDSEALRMEVTVSDGKRWELNPGLPDIHEPASSFCAPCTEYLPLVFVVANCVCVCVCWGDSEEEREETERET